MIRAVLWQKVQDVATRLALRELANLIDPPPKAAFRAYQAVAVSYTGSKQKVAFDTIEYDYENEFSTSTSYFTPKHDGVYLIDAGCTLNKLQGDGAQTELYVYKNGARARFLYFSCQGASTGPTITGIGTFQVKAGDVLEVRLTVAAAATPLFAGTDSTWFSATLLRKTA